MQFTYLSATDDLLELLGGTGSEADSCADPRLAPMRPLRTVMNQ